MSDSSGGRGWWLANDGKWYPPPDEHTPVSGESSSDVSEEQEAVIDLTGSSPVVDLTPPPVPPSRSGSRWGSDREVSVERPGDKRRDVRSSPVDED